MGKYQVHGPGLSNYNEVPNIYADISIGTVNRKDYGDSIDVDVSGSLLALVNPSYFGYTLKIYVSLDSQNFEDAVQIIDKPALPNTWGDYKYG